MRFLVVSRGGTINFNILPRPYLRFPRYALVTGSYWNCTNHPPLFPGRTTKRHLFFIKIEYFSDVQYPVPSLSCSAAGSRDLIRRYKRHPSVGLPPEKSFRRHNANLFLSHSDAIGYPLEKEATPSISKVPWKRRCIMACKGCQSSH